MTEVNGRMAHLARAFQFLLYSGIKGCDLHVPALAEEKKKWLESRSKN
jgi:hypothetical protein